MRRLQLRSSGANAEKSDLISLVQIKTASAAAASEFLLSRQLVSHSRLLIPPSLRPWQLPAADSPEEGVVPLVQETSGTLETWRDVGGVKRLSVTLQVLPGKLFTRLHQHGFCGGTNWSSCS